MLRSRSTSPPDISAEAYPLSYHKSLSSVLIGVEVSVCDRCVSNCTPSGQQGHCARVSRINGAETSRSTSHDPFKASNSLVAPGHVWQRPGLGQV